MCWTFWGYSFVEFLQQGLYGWRFRHSTRGGEPPAAVIKALVTSGWVKKKPIHQIY